MINLLPDENKRELKAARTNVILLRYNFVVLGMAIFLLISGIVVFAVLGGSKGAAESANASNNNRADEFAATKQQADQYRQNLATAKKILDNDVTYTDLVFAITNLLPSGVVLDSLNLSSKDFGTQTLINAHAKDYTAATELKSRFQASPMFSNVHFQSLNSADSSTSNTPYPVGISINVTINKVAKQ